MQGEQPRPQLDEPRSGLGRDRRRFDGGNGRRPGTPPFLEERIARFMVPTRWFVRDEPLPRGATGKILKREIRDQVLADEPAAG